MYKRQGQHGSHRQGRRHPKGVQQLSQEPVCISRHAVAHGVIDTSPRNQGEKCYQQIAGHREMCIRDRVNAGDPVAQLLVGVLNVQVLGLGLAGQLEAQNVAVGIQVQVVVLTQLGVLIGVCLLYPSPATISTGPV